ncbi:hypothetical protein ACQ3JU_1130 (plasmid) [Bradyrhizobium guangxiense]
MSVVVRAYRHKVDIGLAVPLNYGKRKLYLHCGLGEIGRAFALTDCFNPKARFTYESSDLVCRERNANRGPIAVRWIEYLLPSVAVERYPHYSDFIRNEVHFRHVVLAV